VTEPSPEAAKKKPLPDAPLEQLIHDHSPEVLIAVAGNSRLTEDLALALLSPIETRAHPSDDHRAALEHTAVGSHAKSTP